MYILCRLNLYKYDSIAIHMIGLDIKQVTDVRDNFKITLVADIVSFLYFSFLFSRLKHEKYFEMPSNIGIKL